MKELETLDAINMKKRHRDYFHTNITKNISFRVHQLKLLKAVIKFYESDLIDALYKDLKKSAAESYMTEIGYIYKSIDDMQKNCKRYAKPVAVKTPYYMQPSKSYIVSEPYGTVLIIGPFNYPFHLVMEPLIGAIAAGNCAVIKPSELTPTVSKVIQKIIREAFHPSYIECVLGSIPTTTALLHAGFDYIFFTGSPTIGKVVMKAAAKHLTPVTLELGGKSPVIVDQTANIKLAAKRILWGKTLNVGQTCIAPDYIYVHDSVKHALIQEMKRCLRRFYGEDAKNSTSYGRIVNKRHAKRLINIIELEKEHILLGGSYNENSLYIEPTLIEATSWSQPCMKEELFGPILPIMTYFELDEVISDINKQEKPLALYIFSKDNNAIKKIIKRTSSGGTCINDVLNHCTNPNLPFGGVGNSGMGSYHAKESFVTFSHRKSMFINYGNLSSLIANPPFGTLTHKLVKTIFH